MAKNIFVQESVGREQAQVVGFQTARGSMYRYDPDKGVSQRLKTSLGDGQGQVGQESMCAFLPEALVTHVHKNFHYQNRRYRYRLGWGKENKEVGLFTKDRIDLPEDARMALYIFDQEDDKYVLSIFLDHTKPVIGFAPLEKSYRINSNGQVISSTHLGNRIVALYTDQAGFDAEWKMAEVKLGVDSFAL